MSDGWTSGDDDSGKAHDNRGYGGNEDSGNAYDNRSYGNEDSGNAYGSRSYGSDDRTCRNCNEVGHMARECPQRSQRDSGCFSCGEEGHMSRDCPSGGSRSRACHKCNEEGHMARECPNAPEMTCRRCNETGHMARECPSAPDRGCFNCGQEGHMKSDCPEPLKERRPMVCRNCQQEGHKAAECENEAVPRLGESGQPLPQAVSYIPVVEEVTDAAFQDLAYDEADVGRYDTFEVSVSDPNFNVPLKSFEDADLNDSLRFKLRDKMKFTKPTPIQKYCIPILAAGKDLIACSQTGSGKSAAFILPILQTLQNDPTVVPASELAGEIKQKPLVVVLSPTRELCIQLDQHFRLFSHGAQPQIGCNVAYGGFHVRTNREKIQSGTHILCAVPGRLNQFVQEGLISFEKVRYFVLDEADRMLDDGFQQAIEGFINHPTMPPKENRQTLMFSATFQSNVEQIARHMMRSSETVKVVVGILGGVNSDITQSFVSTPNYKAKRDALEEILQTVKGAKVDEEVSRSERGRVIVFVEQKKNADVLAIYLNSSGYSTTTMHGDRDQRQREEALRTFRKGEYSILVTTEVAARGLDIKGVGLVVNFDLPRDIDKFVHRVGRTGRVGTHGRAISFFDPEKDSDLAPLLVKVLNDCNQPIPDFISGAANGGYYGGGEEVQYGNGDTVGYVDEDDWGPP